MDNEFEDVDTPAEMDEHTEAWNRRELDAIDKYMKFKECALNDAREAITLARGNKEILAAIGKAASDERGDLANLRDELVKKGVTKKDWNELVEIGEEAWANVQSQRPQTPGTSTGASRPRGRIINTNAQMSTILAEARAAVDDDNVPPELFRRGSAVVRTVKTKEGLQIQALEPAVMQEYLAHVASWYYVTRATEEDGEASDKYQHVFPPMPVAKAMLGSPSETLPELTRVASTPFFDKGGVLITDEGYHAGAKTFMALGKGLVVPPVPAVPPDAEVAASKVLLDELIHDFMFDRDADKAHYMALVFEHFVRPMILGRTPMHVIEAPEAGSGKSLLGNVCAYIATGEAMPYRPYPTQEEEREKSIMSALVAGGPFIAFDNVKGTVESPSLEAALTTRYPHARQLGVTKDVAAENNASWLITINNGGLSRDLGRRAVRTRIDTKTDRPEKRDASTFLHPNLEKWVEDNRGILIHAILTLTQSWISAGKKPYPKTKASFESWSEVVGGILSHAGFTGFLDEATEDAMVVTDVSRSEAEEFAEGWFQTFGYRVVTAKDLLKLAAPPEIYKTKDPESEDVVSQERPCREPKYLSGVLGIGQPGGRPQRMANWLIRNKGRVLGGRVIKDCGKDSHLKVQTYQLVDAADPVPAPVAPVVEATNVEVDYEA